MKLLCAECKFCTKLFCCVECRIRHEIRNHFPLFSELFSCGLCSGNEKIVLQKENTNNYIDHLCAFHLPLRCGKCSLVFQNKADLITVHTCVSSGEKTCNEVSTSKMGLEYEAKIKPIIEEESEQEETVEKTKPNNGSVADGSSINNSDNRAPNNLVRQTSTPMTKLVHEVKRNTYDSMSASSIQMSSIENCSSENDVSPPVPSATPHLNQFKQPSRRMPISEVPFRHVMTKSVQRAFNKQRYVGTPPLDLRTTPVIRRTSSLEGNVKQRPITGRNDSDLIDLLTTPVIRRNRQIEGKNLAIAINNPKSDDVTESPNESEQEKIDQPNTKSEMSTDKSSNTLFETCNSFASSVISPDLIPETPRFSGLKRASTFSGNQKGSEKQWPTPVPEIIPAPHVDKSSADPSKLTDEKDKEIRCKHEASKGLLWSLVSSVLRFTAGAKASDNVATDNNNSLIKRCASFTGILPKKPVHNLDNGDGPYKRRRTITLSKVETGSQERNIGYGFGPQKQRISGRPPIDRMRQS